MARRLDEWVWAGQILEQTSPDVFAKILAVTAKAVRSRKFATFALIPAIAPLISDRKRKA